MFPILPATEAGPAQAAAADARAAAADARSATYTDDAASARGRSAQHGRQFVGPLGRPARPASPFHALEAGPAPT